MILGPPSPCFVEVDEAVSALQKERGDDRPVVFHWQWNVEEIPQGSVIYNFDLPLVHFDVDHMRAAAKVASEVWDFSARGAEIWRRIGVDAKHVPVGYHPSMVRFERAAEPDIDVVFVGSLNARRLRVLNALVGCGLEVVYGSPERAERDALLARARCSVNMLYYESGSYPMLRAAHLLANGVPYVPEAAPECEQDPMSGNVVPYERLVSAVADMVRGQVSWDGRTAFARKPMVLP